MDYLSLREMERKDLEEIVRIERSSSPTPWSDQLFLAEIANPLSYCFVAPSDTGSDHPILGFICFRNIGEESELLNLCVHPRHRGRGLGRRLMRFYVEFCAQREIRTFHLEVSVLNQPALRLYTSFSYEPAGIRKGFYNGKVDALRMERKNKSGQSPAPICKNKNGLDGMDDSIKPRLG